MRQIIAYLRDSRIWIPIAFLLGFELLMQTGLYGRYLLKRHSYAENVRRIVRVVESSPVQANALILGTSVPYQGILMPRLNEQLDKSGLIVQSAACEGAMIEVQYMLYRELSEDLPNLKTVIFVADTALAWKMRYRQEESNRSMMAQFSRLDSLSLLHELDYRLSFDDYTYFFIRTITYQKDMRDLILHFSDRYKDLLKKWRTDEGIYPYVNMEKFSLEAFHPDDLQSCIANSQREPVDASGRPLENKDGDFFDENGNAVTNAHHANAVFQTCFMASREMQFAAYEGKRQWRDLYFQRLDRLFREIQANGQRIIIIYPPYSEMVGDLNGEHRKNIWHEQVQNSCAPGMCFEIDTRHALDGPANNTYYYDILHLNRAGAKIWTDILAPRLSKLAPAVVSSD